MAGDEQTPSGPDLSDGFDVADLREGVPVLGHIEGEPVLLFLQEGRISAVGGACTHYGGPLGEGLVVDGTVRCPWHHACFSLRTGEALAAPALNPLPTWPVEVRGERIVLGPKHEEPPLSARGRRRRSPARVAILGAGAAGSAAAEWLRREGHDGGVILVDPDPDAPYDRPNLSKDYLAGSAPEEWIPLRPSGFYGEHGIERVVDRAVRLDPGRRRVELESTEPIEYDALLIATGATPRTLAIPGSDREHVHTLRSLADCRAIIRDATKARHVVVAGASFIGMEAAAALRARDLDVTVVAPDAVPFERTLGADLGALLWQRHEANGVQFRLGHTIVGIGPDHVLLDNETKVQAELVVIGIGVVPDTALAEAAGISVDGGILVDEHLRTSDPHVYAAGDNARYPDHRSGRRIRIEHWVVAQRQGQAAARNILGLGEPYRDVPFFWTAHFGQRVSYVGHADRWDRVESPADQNEKGRSFRYLEGNRLLALATLGRDRLSLETEAAMGAEPAVSPAQATP